MKRDALGFDIARSSGMKCIFNEANRPPEHGCLLWVSLAGFIRGWDSLFYDFGLENHVEATRLDSGHRAVLVHQPIWFRTITGKPTLPRPESHLMIRLEISAFEISAFEYFGRTNKL